MLRQKFVDNTEELPKFTGKTMAQMLAALTKVKERLEIADKMLSERDTQLEQMKNVHNIKVNDLKTKIQEEEKTKKNLESKLAEMTAVLTTVKKRLQIAESKATQLTDELKDCNKEYSELHQTASDIQEKYNNLHDAVKSHINPATETQESKSNYDREEFIYKRSNLSF
jgi:chromosome segregation ATPase